VEAGAPAALLALRGSYGHDGSVAALGRRAGGGGSEQLE